MSEIPELSDEEIFVFLKEQVSNGTARIMEGDKEIFLVAKQLQTGGLFQVPAYKHSDGGKVAHSFKLSREGWKEFGRLKNDLGH